MISMREAVIHLAREFAGSIEDSVVFGVLGVALGLALSLFALMGDDDDWPQVPLLYCGFRTWGTLVILSFFFYHFGALVPRVFECVEHLGLSGLFVGSGIIVLLVTWFVEAASGFSDSDGRMSYSDGVGNRMPSLIRRRLSNLWGLCAADFADSRMRQRARLVREIRVKMDDEPEFFEFIVKAESVSSAVPDRKGRPGPSRDPADILMALGRVEACRGLRQLQSDYRRIRESRDKQSG